MGINWFTQEHRFVFLPLPIWKHVQTLPKLTFQCQEKKDYQKLAEEDKRRCSTRQGTMKWKDQRLDQPVGGYRTKIICCGAPLLFSMKCRQYSYSTGPFIDQLMALVRSTDLVLQFHFPKIKWQLKKWPQTDKQRQTDAFVAWSVIWRW